MKIKRTKKTDDFRQLKNKIFIRTIIMVAAAFTVFWLIYDLVIYNRFANFMVAFFENVFRLDYDAALTLYGHAIRNNYVLIILIAIAGIFFIMFKLYLSWFTKYFIEINRGIDELIKEDAGDIILFSELSATEKKINLIKRNLDRRKVETQLAEQRKNDLVVYLAHDLKTPLTSVIGYLNLLRDENQISEELREKYLTISLEKAERLEDLINEFFEITRFNLTNITLEYSKVNLTRMLEQLTFEFRPMLSSRNLKCTLDIAPNTMIQCDVDKIQRVFDNLLRNAVYYSFENSTVEIIVTQDKESEENIIRFINYGNTIPEEKLGRIFEQFYRLDTARSSNNGGAGLGLAIAKDIVELHNGTITAYSEDQKTVFEVSIPLS